MPGTIKYSITKDKGNVVHSLSWDIAFGLIDKPRKLLSFSKESTESVFQISIKIDKDNHDEVDMTLSFLYPADAYIEYDVMYTDPKINPCDPHAFIHSNFKRIKANEWNRITRFNRKHIYVHKWCLGEFVQFKFLIKFAILVDRYINEKPQSIISVQGFFITSLFSDAVLKSCDGKEYKIHKVITSSKSEVLKANFQHGMTKNDTTIVESPFESDVLEAVLSFMYSDEDSSINGIPEKVLPAADYYQLLQLKSLCEKELCKKITIENSIDLLELADLHSAEMLKESVQKFMEDKAELLVKTEAWAELKSVRLMRMIFENVKCCKEQEIIFYECEFCA